MKRVTATILSWILFAGLSAHAAAEGPPLKVFLFAGTSNLASGKVAELPDDLKQPQDDVLVWQQGHWLPLNPGKSPLRWKGDHFGPEVAFARDMTKYLGEPIGIITTTLGAVDNHKNYGEIVKLVKDAQKSRPIIIAGMLVQAGERDAETEERANALGKNLTDLIESARRDFGNAAMPLAINRAIPYKNKLIDVVRQAEASLHVPGFRMVDCDDVPRGGDNTHYTSKGQLEFGKRVADAMIELMKADKPQKNSP